MRRSMVRRAVAVAALGVLAAACGDDSTETPSVSTAPEGPSVAFSAPADGASVTNPVAIELSSVGFALEPAGDVHEGAGHLHVMVDTPCVEPGTPIPRDAQHVHFGKGQAEGRLDLAAGEHTLCLQAGDGAHVALDLTDEITVTVDDSPSVAIVEPAGGATVASPVALSFAAFNFTVEPAGEVHDGAGHLHVMVDVPCVEPGQPIPRDDAHVHLGQGQTTAELPLAPGEHTVCLQAGDGAHVALDVTREVTFTVQ